MIALDLDPNQMRELLLLLRTNHALRIGVTMLDLNHKSLGSISTRFISGSLDIDADADVTRSLKLDLLDADRGLNLDKESPNDGAVFIDRMVSVTYGVGRLDRTVWYDIPIFTGPITKVDRDGVVVSIEAQGKEAVSEDNPWRAKSWKPGGLKTALIRAILATTGETRFKFESSKAKVPVRVAIETRKDGKDKDKKPEKVRKIIRFALGRDATPFNLAKSVASGMGMQLFYDARGVARLRRKPSKSVFTFNGSNMMSIPQVGYSIENVVNAVEVVGTKKPPSSKNQKDKKTKPKAKKFSVRVVAPRNHPLSPWSLARGGVPRYLPKFIEDSSIKTVAEANAVAKRELNSALVETVDASFEAFPNPLLEEGDPYTIDLPSYYGTASIKKLTLPLQPGQGMSVGYTRRVKPSRLARKTRTRRR